MLFGPLDISYCLFFYVLSISNLFVCFCLFIIFILNLKIVKKAKEIFFALILFFMMYFQNRLLYNMCNQNIIPKSEYFESNESQFDGKKKGLNNLGVPNHNVNDVYKMLARIIDVTKATENPAIVNTISDFVTQVEQKKEKPSASGGLVYYGASAEDVKQLYGALKNAFNRVTQGNYRELSNRIRNEGGLLRSMVNAEKQILAARKELADANAVIKATNAKYSTINTNVNTNTNLLNAANVGLNSIQTSQALNAETVKQMLEYVNTNSAIWNEQSDTMLENTRNMMASLSSINSNLDPANYR